MHREEARAVGQSQEHTLVTLQCLAWPGRWDTQHVDSWNHPAWHQLCNFTFLLFTEHLWEGSMCLLHLVLRLHNAIAHKGVRNTVLCTCTAPDYKSKPHGEIISTIQQLSSLSASCSHLHNAAHLILKPLLAWGKNLEVWSKQCLHQNVTSSDFQHLKFTISIEKAGFYKSSLQILKFSCPELHEWCYACSRKQRSMKKSPSERYKTATLKLLRLW